MSFLTITAILTGAIALLYLLWSTVLRKTRRTLPPGPARLPILGNGYLARGPDRNQRILRTGKEYGGIFTMRLGVVNLVTITSYKHFREAVIDKAWQFAGRPPGMWFSDETTGRNPGILASGVDEAARNVRKFTLIALRSFGFGKADMQKAILQQCGELNEVLREQTGRPFNPSQAVATASANVIAATAFGKTYKHGDGELLAVTGQITMGMRIMLKAFLFQMFPFLKYIAIVPNYREAFNQCFISSKQFVVEIVSQHVPTREPGNPRDFLDVWLDENAKDSESAAKFPLERLPNVLMDLLGGGFETTTLVFQWLFAIMLHRPDIQGRIHEELDRQTDGRSEITLENREQLPYTEAVVLETLRMYPPAPFTAPHMATEDATLAGYHLPKDTQVNLHLYSILNDPELWTDPDVYRPERFIQDNLLKVPEYFVPFGAGRRSCIAEQPARKELFLIFANIMQSFRLKLPPGNDLPSLVILDAVGMRIPPFDVVFEER